MAFATDMLVVSSETNLANFPAVADYPRTEESRQIAASVRATINAFFAFHSYDSSTPGRDTFGTEDFSFRDANSVPSQAMSDPLEEIEQLVGRYVDQVRAELEARWQAWPLDLTKPEVHEVVGALLARQVNMATSGHVPGRRNHHLAPAILRMMVDV